MKFISSDNSWLPLSDQICKVTRTDDNKIIEIQTLDIAPTGLKSIVKLSSKEYLYLPTNEVKQYKVSDHKDNKQSLKRTFANMRRIINNNFLAEQNELFITLTYADKIRSQSLELINKDIEAFSKKLRYKCGTIKYAYVVEPQENGNFHFHYLIKALDRKKLYIPNADIELMWSHGFTQTKKLKVDSVGAYLTAYLSNIELSGNDIKFADKVVSDSAGSTKAFVKGARLHFYKKGMKIFRYSSNCNPVTTEKMRFYQVLPLIGYDKPSYSRMLEIEDDDGHKINTICNYSYNFRGRKREDI